LCSSLAPCIVNKYVMCDWSIYRIFVVNTGCKRESLQMMIFVNVCSTFCIVELETCFEAWIKNDVIILNLFHLSYLITHMIYVCSQWAPNVQVKYFMFDLTMYRIFVPNRGWKFDYLQIIIFVTDCSTWNVVELKTHFETE
jgi:hypothetical protein